MLHVILEDKERGVEKHHNHTRQATTEPPMCGAWWLPAHLPARLPAHLAASAATQSQNMQRPMRIAKGT